MPPVIRKYVALVAARNKTRFRDVARDEPNKLIFSFRKI